MRPRAGGDLLRADSSPRDLAVDADTAARLIDLMFAPPLLLDDAMAEGVHRLLAAGGVTGGAAYDGLVALAARAHGALLLTRDARARSTYEALGVPVELVASGGPVA